MLVVDDTRAIHDDIRKVLAAKSGDNPVASAERELFGTAAPLRATRANFEIDSAYQGTEGVERVRAAVREGRPYAVAFVDMRMPPGDDGLPTIRGLWQIDPRIQVVICSAYSDHSWEEICAATSESDQVLILRKPFEPIEVLQLAHALSKKWDLQRSLERHVENLEALVTARTRELGEKQAVFQLIMENVTDLIAVTDANCNRLYNSPSYRTVLGFNPDELQHTHALDQIHPDDRATVARAVENARTTGRGDLIVYRMRHRDGTWRTLESCAGVVHGADGQLANFVVVARDVTRRRESELKHQLGQKLESIGRLAAGIAHEINTPTQYIADNTRFLSDAFRQVMRALEPCRATGAKPAATPDGGARGTAVKAPEVEAELEYLLTEIPRALQQNLDGLARVSRIVQSLKEFSYPNSPDKAPVDLNRAIETAIAVCRHEWKYVADVTTEFAPALPPVPCLLDEFNQAMLNLLVNAAHAIGEALKQRGEKRGTITVRTRAEGTAAVVEVADTGIGIASELQGRIFEPFFTTKAVGEGTGQGLAIVHTVIVKHHQGTVDFTSKAGEGTTFRLRLPLEPATVTPASVAA